MNKESNNLNLPLSRTGGKTLIVIGGGAAGFFCAINAARMNKNLQVIIVEKTNKLLSKVKVSGGGRCNVTNACNDIDEMSKCYPRGYNFVKKTFHQFFTTDSIKWFEERGIKLKSEEDGRIFPVTDSSETIINCLMQEANKYGVQIVLNTVVQSVKPEGEKFLIEVSGNSKPRSITSHFICIATGGYPTTSKFKWLQHIGHTIVQPVPSLFTFNLAAGQPGLPKHPITNLMGISVPKARVKINGSKQVEEGAVLITHWGLSGPAVLRLSAWGARDLNVVNYNFRVHINWLPQFNEISLKDHLKEIRNLNGPKKIINYNFAHLPNRLWQFLMEESGVNSDRRFADLPATTENKWIRNLVNYTVEVKGKTTFKEEFVTAGGINLNEVDVNTMMSKKNPRLFFAGEVLDVDGITGGFNFQHAWTSGWIAAKNIAEISKEE